MIWPLFKFLGRNSSNFWVFFFRKFKTQKSHFEINWPLATLFFIFYLFFSLLQPVTKNLILNNKCQLKVFFVVVASWKEKRPGCLFSFWIVMTTKNLSWHLVFSIWFLATGWSNESNIYSIIVSFIASASD